MPTPGTNKTKQKMQKQIIHVSTSSTQLLFQEKQINKGKQAYVF